MIQIKAIILAAGYATRLYPLTENQPKSLLPIGGKPIIEHILFRIEEVDDIDEIFIVTNDKFNTHFTDWQKTYKSLKKIVIVNDWTTSNENRLGAVGDMHYVIEHQNIDHDLLVIAGDNLFEFSLIHLVRFFKEKKASVVALYDLGHIDKVANKLGVALVDDNLKVIDFEEKPAKPKSTLAATACYVFAKKDVEELEQMIKEHHMPDNSGDFIKHLAEKKHVYGFIFEEQWYDIGSHDQYHNANKIYLEKEKKN
ncbi:MAG: nucleotidyltransferase family protein [Nanoarchaeota archaeon]|nr:nucleotidyltransferase family protein [Nanoarchaeota archaeon]